MQRIYATGTYLKSKNKKKQTTDSSVVSTYKECDSMTADLRLGFCISPSSEKQNLQNIYLYKMFYRDLIICNCMSSLSSLCKHTESCLLLKLEVCRACKWEGKMIQSGGGGDKNKLGTQATDGAQEDRLKQFFLTPIFMV